MGQKQREVFTTKITEMKDHIITLKTALLAKQCGFDWETYDFYIIGKEGDDVDDYGRLIEGRELSLRDRNKDSMYASAPTQSILQRWLREKKYLKISMEYSCGLPELWIPFVNYFEEKSKAIAYIYYEEALEGALQKSLRMLIERQ